MKAIKRTVAALLATLMLSTSVNVLAAESYTDKEAIAVAKVNGAGIMQGTDKGFEPSKSLTRAEAAAIIVRMKGVSESTVKTMAGTTLFKDVAASHWASGYVNVASNYGIVKGVSATEFAPEREVTVAEFTTMAVRALGAGQLVDSEGVWPTNYVNFANEEGILDDVTAIYTATASRMNAATIVANSLVAPLWEKTGVKSNGEIEWSNKNEKTILENTLNIDETKSVLLEGINTKDRELSAYHLVWNEETEKNDKKYDYSKEDVAESINLAALKDGIAYDIWYNTKDKKIVAVFKSEDSKQKTFEFTEIVKNDKTGSLTIKVNGEDKKFDFDKTKSNVYFNKATAAKKITEVTYDKANVFGSVVVEGNEIKYLYMEQYKNYGIVDEVKTSKVVFKSGIDTIANASLIIDEDNKEYIVTKNGKEIKVTDLEEDDAIEWYVTGDKYVINVMDSEVSGKVKALSTKAITIGSSKYTIVDDLELSCQPKDEVTIYLNRAGKVVMADTAESVDGELAIIGQLREIKEQIAGDGATHEIKLISLDGTTTEWVELDDEKCLEEVAAYTFGGLKIGTLVTYKKSNGKIILTDYTKEDNEDKIQTFKGFKAGKHNLVTMTGSTGFDGDYYVDENTKFYSVVKTLGTEGKSDYRIKLEMLSLDDLDTKSTMEGYIAGIDYDEQEVDYVVITKDVNRVSEANFAFVLDIIEDYEDDDNEDVDTMVSVLYADGTTKDLYVEEDTTTTETLEAGKVFELTLDGDLITDAEIPAGVEDELITSSFTSGFKYFLGKEYANGTFEFNNYKTDLTTGVKVFAASTKNATAKVEDAVRFTLADDVIVVKYNSSKEEYTKSSIASIKTLEDVSYTSTEIAALPEADQTVAAEKVAEEVDDANDIKTLYGYISDDSELTIVAIVYNK